jgi:hypothetical protein
MRRQRCTYLYNCNRPAVLQEGLPICSICMALRRQMARDAEKKKIALATAS